MPVIVVLNRAAPGSNVEVAAAALERGVKLLPLSWHRSATGAPGLVLGYAAATPAQIIEGVAAGGDVRRASSASRAP